MFGHALHINQSATFFVMTHHIIFSIYCAQLNGDHVYDEKLIANFRKIKMWSLLT